MTKGALIIDAHECKLSDYDAGFRADPVRWLDMCVEAPAARSTNRSTTFSHSTRSHSDTGGGAADEPAPASTHGGDRQQPNSVSGIRPIVIMIM